MSTKRRELHLWTWLSAIAESLAGAVRKMIHSADPEILIGLGRLITALFAFIAILIDPTKPAALQKESRIVLGMYVVFALVIVMFPLRKPVGSRIHMIVHVLDAAILGWLAFLTNELTSPFFSFLPFILMAMTLRWELRGAVSGAALLIGVLIIVGLPDLSDGESELDIFIMRAVYILVAAVMLGYLGAYRERSRKRFAQLANWPFEAVVSDQQVWLSRLCAHASSVLGSARLLIAWCNQECGTVQIAFWSGGEIKSWQGHEPQLWQNATQELQLGQTAPSAEILSLDAIESLEAMLAQGGTIFNRTEFYICKSGFSGINFDGTLFVIDPSCNPDECVSLTAIIAGRIGSEFERLAFIQAAANNAREHERARVARELHDSVLQDLTAASLKLKVASHVATSGLEIRLREATAIIAEQQKRIRQFVEDNLEPDNDIQRSLQSEMTLAASLLAQKWQCKVRIGEIADEIHFRPAIIHEMNQLLSEATANAVRHGHAKSVSIEVKTHADKIVMQINDDGFGMMEFHPVKLPKSLKSRIEALGGTLALRRLSPGLGLDITLPLHGTVA